MRIAVAICALTLCVVGGYAQTTLEVGSGAPNEFIKSQFQNAFSRGVFSRIATLPPTGAVRRYGATGLIQEFNDSTRSSGRMALIRSTAVVDETNPYGGVYQLLTDVYTYFTSVGVNTAGYPIMDTQSCPGSACTYQIFDKKYLLFAYVTGGNDPVSITVRDPFYTRWDYFGGISKFGPAVSAETAVTGSQGGNATAQTFKDGIIYNITSGTLNGRLVTVRQPIYSLYVTKGGHAGTLGYPTADEITLANGRKRQVFEGGSIEYDTDLVPVLRTPVRTVVLKPSTSPVRLNFGDTLAMEAVVYGGDDSVLVDRPVAFTTTNARVISVEASGLKAVIRAVGGGTARVSATSEGKVSLPVEFVVTAQCCAVGEGAPSLAIQQAFQDVVTRNRLQLRLPGPERVRRSGSGYVQEFQSADAAGVRVLIGMSDRSAQAYFVAGSILSRWEELGGTGSQLGYAASDPSPSGRQLFEFGALAGSPIRTVTGSILTRWATTGYEDGPAGMPAGDPMTLTTFTGISGQFQAFANGVIAGGTRGAFLVSGPAADRYVSLGGALGVLGFPTGDEFGLSGFRHQDFEGGYIEYANGTTDARAVTRERRPAVTANPSAVLPGTRIRLTVSGFADGSTVRVSITGQQDFVVRTQTGSYSWELIVPSNAQAGVVRVRAIDSSDPNASADGSYTVRTLAEARVQLVKVGGDTQTGAPGGLLPLGLRISLRDDSGNPVAGMAVRFTASPGASVTPESTTTDGSGMAEARLRLPALDGVALVTAEAARQVVTFTARAAGANILNFPHLAGSGSETLGHGTATLADSGALLISVANILRYHQNRGELPQPNGAADPSVLNAFLKRACSTDAQGMQYCDGFIVAPGTSEQIVNLWRLPAFVGGGLAVSVERADPQNVRALVAGGSPVLVALSLSTGGASGSHFVVATGIAADGGVQIFDPVASFGRTRLEEYLDGFTFQDREWTAVMEGAIRLIPRTPTGSAFVVQAFDADLFISSRAGDCGLGLSWPDRPARPDGVAAGARRFRQRACDGEAGEYQVDIQGEGTVRGWLTDLADAGARIELAGANAASFRAFRPAMSLIAEPQQTVLSARAVLNAATLTADVAPGGLISIFGSGLARAGSRTRVEVSGRAATVVAALPFQLNVQLPLETPPGSNVLRVDTPYGTAEEMVEVRQVAPAIFRTAGDATRGLVVNQDGKMNAPATPAKRGEAIVVYATGLGAVTQSGTLAPAQIPVTAVLGGQELRASYAGLAPGMVGLYQVNVVIPVTFPPGLDLSFTIRQGGIEATPVEISIQ